MKKILLLLSIPFVLLSCEHSESIAPLEFEPATIGESVVISVEDKEGKYFTFTPDRDDIDYQITLTKLSVDFDLTVGLFEDDPDLSELPVYYTSKNTGLADEILTLRLDPGITYLIEAWNYSSQEGSCTFEIVAVESR